MMSTFEEPETLMLATLGAGLPGSSLSQLGDTNSSWSALSEETEAALQECLSGLDRVGANLRVLRADLARHSPPSCAEWVDTARRSLDSLEHAASRLQPKIDQLKGGLIALNASR
jgi:hypothetical protein